GVSRREVLREVSPRRRFQARAPARLLHRGPRGRARYSVADTGRRAISHLLSTARVDPAMTAWRLIVTEPCDGATNMAIDEALWRGRHAGPSPPTVRFFAWDPPTVSVRYRQPLDRHVDAPAGHVLPPARRRAPRRGRRASARAVSHPARPARDVDDPGGGPRASPDVRRSRPGADGRLRDGARVDAHAGRAHRRRDQARADAGRRALWPRQLPGRARASLEDW